MRYTLGCVPYVNARPLVDAFEQGPSDVTVLYDVPSRLPTLLKNGSADAILVSSIEALRNRESYVCGLVGIISRDEVKSVKVFSKVPFEKISLLATDASSMTSNCLAQIVLRELYGANPALMISAPDQKEMLAHADACVLIGDIGMTAPTDGLYVLDLGIAWKQLTGKPFIWALWLMRKPDEALAEKLEQPLLEVCFPPVKPFGLSTVNGDDTEELGDYVGRRSTTFANIREPFFERTAQKSGWPLDKVRSYLETTISYWITREDWEGFLMFGEYLHKHHLIDAWWEPARVFANPGVINITEEDKRLMSLFRRNSDQ